MANSLLRYAGGKKWAVTWLRPIIKRHLDRTGGLLIDPFMGGGSIPLSLEGYPMVLSDLLQPLVNFWRVVKDKPGELAWATSGLLIPGVNRENYLKVRDTTYGDAATYAAQFLFFNRLSYNGVVRYNQSGKFNVPPDDARLQVQENFRHSMVGRKGRDALNGGLFPNKEKILHASRALRNAAISCRHFSEALKFVSKGDVLYLDPPYHRTFAGYTGKGFDGEEQARLAALAKEADDKDVLILAHNSDTPEVREWWSWAYKIRTVEKRQVSCDGGGRGPARCFLFTNKPRVLEDW